MGLELELARPILLTSHLLALIGTGVWGGRLGGYAVIILPLSFALGLVAGFIAGNEGLFLAPATVLHWASLVALAAGLVFRISLPLGEAIGTVGLFGLAHGIAQGAATGLSLP
jgi:hydrogenase/urease accessory protein HupE